MKADSFLLTSIPRSKVSIDNLPDTFFGQPTSDITEEGRVYVSEEERKPTGVHTYARHGM